MRKPVIGISAVSIFNPRMYSQRVTFSDTVSDRGGIAVMLPLYSAKEKIADIEEIVSHIDGLLLPGGADVEPSVYGEERLPECGMSLIAEDEYEIALLKEVVRQGKPILGICRGMQITNVAFGGTLYQDIPSQYSKDSDHSTKSDGPVIIHPVKLEEGSHLAGIMGTDIKVNSYHHQAVKDVAPGFKIVGKSHDGINEAMENEDGSILCVQWHPELMQDEECFRKLFDAFIEKCKK